MRVAEFALIRFDLHRDCCGQKLQAAVSAAHAVSPARLSVLEKSYQQLNWLIPPWGPVIKDKMSVLDHDEPQGFPPSGDADCCQLEDLDAKGFWPVHTSPEIR